MDETKQKQVAMHKDFFDRTQKAIDQGCYLEAVFLEYAAIESRLEILMGVLGAPCNKELPPNQRKEINISHRIRCVSGFYKNEREIGTTKLTTAYFKRLNEWIKERNSYIHGLYKNEIVYIERSAGANELAEQGLKLARLLYNEVKRIR